jgi:hypothetical protein
MGLMALVRQLASDPTNASPERKLEFVDRSGHSQALRPLRPTLRWAAKHNEGPTTV